MGAMPDWKTDMKPQALYAKEHMIIDCFISDHLGSHRDVNMQGYKCLNSVTSSTIAQIDKRITSKSSTAKSVILFSKGIYEQRDEQDEENC